MNDFFFNLGPPYIEIWATSDDRKTPRYTFDEFSDEADELLRNLDKLGGNPWQIVSVRVGKELRHSFWDAVKKMWVPGSLIIIP